MPRSSPRLAPGQHQPGIQSFARATKPGVSSTATKLDSGKPAATAPSLPVSPSKKRKLTELENVGSNGVGAGVGVGFEAGTGAGSVTGEENKKEELTLTPSKTLRFSELSVTTPRSGGHYTSTSNPTRSRSQLRPSSRLQRTQCARVSDFSPLKRNIREGGVLKKPETQVQLAPISRPACLDDLLKLHSSFLTALAVHSAHNGVAAPADTREFLRSVTQLWRKRKVVVKDLQRLVWIWEQSGQTTKPAFRLANYGLGRVCLERVFRGDYDGFERLDEAECQEQFEQTLDLLWEKTLDSVPNGDEEQDQVAMHFVETLGVSPVHECLAPFTAFRKGQQRLQDLKGGVIRMKTQKFHADAINGNDNTPKVLETTTNRRKGLLDRIKNKELRQSKLPPPPSKEMLLRRAAVERMEDVAAVLASLRPVGYVGSGIKAMLAAQRKPFQIPVIVQHVQDSVRNPISQQEVEICIELMARVDVAGHWVNFVPVNKIQMVVLKSCADVSPKDIAAKACQLRIGYDDEAVSPSKTSTN